MNDVIYFFYHTFRYDIGTFCGFIGVFPNVRSIKIFNKYIRNS